MKGAFTFHDLTLSRSHVFKHERGAVEAPRVACCVGMEGLDLVLCRSGNDLLSRVLRHSTIGAEEFNGRVRDGIGFGLLAQITGPAKNKMGLASGCGCSATSEIVSRRSHFRSLLRLHGLSFIMHDPDTDHESNQAYRAISTSKLNTLPRLHTWPINVVVFHGSQGSTRFEVGFPLRCLQRLSRPYIATLHCGWRHNSSTRGTSIPVLSY